MVLSSRRTLFLVVFILVICGFLGMLFGQKITPAAAAGGDSDVRDSLRQFATVYDVVEKNYSEPVNADKAIYNGAIPGMLHVLDPHSNFFDPKSYSALREEQRGKYYGVGMTIAPRNNKIIVLAPFVGTPAYRAGIRPGDVIIAVDGKPTDNMATGDVADLLKGAKGTTDHISILREAAENPLEFTVIRGTASAAEIVSGDIQDHDRGVIAGETTFGKRLVQTVYPLSENTGLALTTAKYYTPSGRLIQRDYTGVSLYDYYYNREQEENPSNNANTTSKEVKLTDSGRTMFGGGGITPDVKVPPFKTTHFE